MEQLSEVELTVNEVVSAMKWCDCEVIPSTYGSFSIACGEDLTYYHSLELIFNSVLFAYCRYEFQVDIGKGLFAVNDPFTSPVSLIEDVKNEGYKLYTIHEDDGHIYCIASKELLVSNDIVLHYYAENLKPGQRLASWVEKP